MRARRALELAAAHYAGGVLLLAEAPREGGWVACLGSRTHATFPATLSRVKTWPPEVGAIVGRTACAHALPVSPVPPRTALILTLLPLPCEFQALARARRRARPDQPADRHRRAGHADPRCGRLGPCPCKPSQTRRTQQHQRVCTVLQFSWGSRGCTLSCAGRQELK
jgi:hypothetical protein